MDFKRVAPSFWESECGVYSISKVPVEKGGSDYIYNAWHGSGLRHVGGPFTHSADAKKACVEHSERVVA